MTFDREARLDASAPDAAASTSSKRVGARRRRARRVAPAQTPPSGVAPVDVTSSSVALLRADPIRLTFPQTRRDESSETRSVRITNITDRPLEILDGIVRGERRGAFTVLGIDSTMLEPGEGTQVHLVFRPEHPGLVSARCWIDTDHGPGIEISLVGRGKTALIDALELREDPDAPEEAAAKDRELDKAAHLAAARGGEIVVESTYASMEAAFSAACDAAMQGHYDEAHALAVAVRDRLGMIAREDRAVPILRSFNIGIHAPLGMLGMATTATNELAVRAGMRSSIAGALCLAEFQAASGVIPLLTGESRDAGVFTAFDRASLLTTGVVSALPLAFVGAVAAPEAVSALIVRATPIVLAEASTFWFASKELFAWGATYVSRNPDAALAWTEFVAPMLIEGGENWGQRDEFFAKLETWDGFASVFMQMLMGLANARMASDAGPRRQGDDMPGPRPQGGANDGAAPERLLPPRVQAHADAEPPDLTAQAKRLVQDGLDRMAALANAVRTTRSGVAVPRSRSSAVMDGEEAPPLTPDADVAPVADKGTTFGERYGHELHGRRAKRAGARGELHEGTLGEGAITARDLRARGAKEIARVDDELMGDAMITFRLPNRRQVTVREKGAAPPRVQRPKDAARAQELQREAGDARKANAARDAKADALVRSQLVTNAHGVHVDRVFDRIIVGGGPTAVELHATRPESAAARAAHGDDLDLATLVVADASGHWTDAPVGTGQPRHHTEQTAFDVKPGDLVDEPSRFLPASALADAAALTANNHEMPVWRGMRAIRIDETSDTTWLHSDAARRIWVQGADGAEIAIYTRKADIAGGLGKARSLQPDAFGPAPAPGDADPRGQRRADLEAAGLLVSAQDHLAMGTPPDAKKVLISGGGATAPWNAKLATQASPGVEITWTARGGTTNVAAQKQLDQVDAAIRTDEAQLSEIELNLAWGAQDAARLEGRRAELLDDLAFLVQRRGDLLHSGDAMQNRNLGPDDALGMTNVHRVTAEIVKVEQVMVGGKAKVRATLSNGLVADYDQVIVNHGPDQSVPGSTPSLLAREKLEVVSTGQRAHIASTDGAVRVFGAAASSMAREVDVGKARDGQSTDDRSTLPYTNQAGYESQPTESRGVPSFYLAGAQIREANQ